MSDSPVKLGGPAGESEVGNRNLHLLCQSREDVPGDRDAGGKVPELLVLNRCKSKSVWL